MNSFTHNVLITPISEVTRDKDGIVFHVGERVKIPSSTIFNKPKQWIIKGFRILFFPEEYRVTFKASDNENDIATVDYLINDIEKYYFDITYFL